MLRPRTHSIQSSASSVKFRRAGALVCGYIAFEFGLYFTATHFVDASLSIATVSGVAGYSLIPKNARNPNSHKAYTKTERVVIGASLGACSIPLAFGTLGVMCGFLGGISVHRLVSMSTYVGHKLHHLYVKMCPTFPSPRSRHTAPPPAP